MGALDVECAWGSLARSTTVSANSVVRVLEDVTVPSSKSLTVNQGTVLKFDEDDGSPGGGNDTSLNELLVSGTLTISGGSASKVKLQPAAASPGEGDWKGVWIDDGGVGKIDYA